MKSVPNTLYTEFQDLLCSCVADHHESKDIADRQYESKEAKLVCSDLFCRAAVSKVKNEPSNSPEI